MLFSHVKPQTSGSAFVAGGHISSRIFMRVVYPVNAYPASRIYCLGTKVVDASHDHEDATDLHKCVSHIQDLPSLKNQNICILVAGAHGGRSDHEIGNINVLCRFPSMPIILRSDDCFIQLLPCSHHHEIHIQSTVEGPHCGVIPIGGPSKRSTTTGLQWNLIMQVDIFISGIFMTVVYPINAYLASGIYCLGTKVVDASHDHEDATDLHKCVSHIQDLPSLKNQNICILVAGALGGSHHHEIHIESTVEEPHCAVIPIGGPSKRSTTTGLQWNLSGHIYKRYIHAVVYPIIAYLASGIYCLETKVVDASHDQHTADLHKCVSYIQDLLSLKNQNICILVAGAHGGRSDHEIGNINVLCRFPSMRIILRSDDCFIQLLPCSHHHEIHIQSTVEGPHCGVIPIGGPSKRSTTTGLQWNLSGHIYKRYIHDSGYPINAYLASGIYCLGTKVVDASHDHEDATDLHKCVSHIQDLPSLKNQNIFILVAGAHVEGLTMRLEISMFYAVSQACG
ncbi:UNVERIFIED_CONTAM: Thiamine pyrophosphokinase [Sesamum latifolium]|uniref:Thiamine pyrophosphokinase n=1 Tax=Sesamum latifolium TaxID=2727402 RepID=A0AAW2Y1N4_9LAMI